MTEEELDQLRRGIEATVWPTMAAALATLLRAEILRTSSGTSALSPERFLALAIALNDAGQPLARWVPQDADPNESMLVAGETKEAWDRAVLQVVTILRAPQEPT